MANIRKDWWKTFFGNNAAEIMFDLQGRPTEREVDTIIRRTRIRKGARILDLGCGLGRHSIEFAKRGMFVTGLDYSKTYLREAQKAARNARVVNRVTFVRGDMRDAVDRVGSGKFDLVVSLFNTFGYFDKKSDDQKVLREISRTLVPGGLLVLNTLNRPGVEQELPYNGWRRPQERYFVLDTARFDDKTSRTHCEWIVIDFRSGKPKMTELPFSQNVYSPDELRDRLTKVGMRVESLWGRLHGEIYKRTSWHQTILARKAR